MLAQWKAWSLAETNVLKPEEMQLSIDSPNPVLASFKSAVEFLLKNTLTKQSIYLRPAHSKML